MDRNLIEETSGSDGRKAVPFAVIRHASTGWNEEGRVQGRSDIPLSPAGRAQAAAWSLPREVEGFRRMASPLIRARETAGLIWGTGFETDERLVEIDWAAWEGVTLIDLRAELGDLRRAWADGGLDFRAPGGESLRDVQARLRPLLAEIAGAGRPTVAVTHQGVIKALTSLATGWDLSGEPPVVVQNECLHIFQIGTHGEISMDRANLPLKTQ